MADIGRILGGLGAAVAGTAPQYRQQMMQEDVLARKRAMEDEQSAEKRKQTLFADAAAASARSDAAKFDKQAKAQEGIMKGLEQGIEQNADRLQKIMNYAISQTFIMLEKKARAGQKADESASNLQAQAQRSR